MRTRVKMCGTTRLEDAHAAVRCGVDALGFIFYKKSERYVPPETVAAISALLPPFISKVGVFVDASLQEIAGAVNNGISCLQLHGEESPKFCRDLRQKYPQSAIIKAFRVGGESTGEMFTPYHGCVDAYLLDTYQPGVRGGTGQVFDWAIIERLKLQRPVILAGGLSPENVASALKAVQPFAIDINSGVELSPGVKDHARLQAVMRMVAAASCQ